VEASYVNVLKKPNEVEMKYLSNTPVSLNSRALSIKMNLKILPPPVLAKNKE
jgi:hypothetical protein